MITSLKTIKWDDDCFFNEGKWRWLWSFVLGPMWLNVIAQHVMCREFSLVYLSLLSVSWQQLFIPYSNQWVSLFIGAMFVTTNPLQPIIIQLRHILNFRGFVTSCNYFWVLFVWKYLQCLWQPLPEHVAALTPDFLSIECILNSLQVVTWGWMRPIVMPPCWT